MNRNTKSNNMLISGDTFQTQRHKQNENKMIEKKFHATVIKKPGVTNIRKKQTLAQKL